jgi:Tol biopolymer transport system component
VQRRPSHCHGVQSLAIVAMLTFVCGACTSGDSATRPHTSVPPASVSTSSSAFPQPSSSGESAPIDRSELRGRIAFAFDDGIWVSDADGENRRQLTHDGGFDPTWSSDGRRIAYRRLLPDDDGEIWVVNADGSDAHDLVNDPNFSDWGPAWSPNGETIAYDSNRQVGLALWLMDADGSGQHIIGHGHGEYPTWSPDGHRLAYAGGSYYDIHVTDADGSHDVAITTSPAYDMGPAWSPDGSWIAYHTQADHYPNLGEAGMGPEMEIHLVHPDGSDDHRITNDDVEDSFATWSPDGRFVMWSRHGELVVARPDGSGMIEISTGNFPSWTL